jgi:hypothetical protein
MKAIRVYLQAHMVLQPKASTSTFSPLSGPQISNTAKLQAHENYGNVLFQKWITDFSVNKMK